MTLLKDLTHGFSVLPADKNKLMRRAAEEAFKALQSAGLKAA